MIAPAARIVRSGHLVLVACPSKFSPYSHLFSPRLCHLRLSRDSKLIIDSRFLSDPETRELILIKLYTLHATHVHSYIPLPPLTPLHLPPNLSSLLLSDSSPLSCQSFSPSSFYTTRSFRKAALVHRPRPCRKHTLSSRAPRSCPGLDFMVRFETKL